MAEHKASEIKSNSENHKNSVANLLGNDIVKTALSEAVENAIMESSKLMSNDMANLERMTKGGHGGSREANALQEKINEEARHAGIIIKTFEGSLGPDGSKSALDGINDIILSGAERIYGTREGHVYYKDISAVHDVKEHLHAETIKTDDVTSIMDRVQKNLGNVLSTALNAAGVDFATLDYKLSAIRDALRDRSSDVRTATPASRPAKIGAVPIAMAQLGTPEVQAAGERTASDEATGKTKIE